jgi:hypothetical protein
MLLYKKELGRGPGAKIWLELSLHQLGAVSSPSYLLQARLKSKRLGLTHVDPITLFQEPLADPTEAFEAACSCHRGLFGIMSRGAALDGLWDTAKKLREAVAASRDWTQKQGLFLGFEMENFLSTKIAN